MALFHHSVRPAADGGMNLAHVLTAATPASGGGITLGADFMSCNLGYLPPRTYPVIGLYVTQGGGGSGYIAATDAQLAAHPDCVKIAQLPTGDPVWADALDFEAGAATITELQQWAAGATESYDKGLHPGQRMPVIYVSAANVHVVANALIDARIGGGVGIGLANWNLTEAQAAADVIDRAGPYPVVWAQYADAGHYDLDVWATAWLNTRSGTPKVTGYGAPRNLKATGGHDSVRFTFDPPGTGGLPDPADYEIYLYTSAACTRSSLVETWGPRHTGGATSFQGGSLARGRTYYAHVVAAGPDGTDVRPNTYAGVKFATG